MRKSISKILLIMVVLIVAGCSASVDNFEELLEKNIDAAQMQYTIMNKFIGDSEKNPRSVDEKGETIMVPSSDWTSGFYPGGLWYLYEITGEDKWKNSARKHTIKLEQEKYNNRTHDMGFKIYCSFGNGFRLTGDDEYKEIMLHSAETLSSRFDPVVGCIRSWDFNRDVWQFPVIIDNMMNLELLFRAAKESGDSKYYDIAVSHADKTMEHHYRDDYSTWHVVDYDTTSGKVLNKHTHQGFSHESSWARGQAWGLYGYTMCYRETREERYLEQSEKIAGYLLEHPNLPEDGVPYWDFDAPNIPNEERDVSAAAIIASALYELQQFSQDESNSEKYLVFADKLMKSLSSEKYLAKKGNNAFILKHSVGSRAHDSEVDVPLIYADYYFLEANLRKMNLTKK